jgi:hypothetical protein
MHYQDLIQEILNESLNSIILDRNNHSPLKAKTKSWELFDALCKTYKSKFESDSNETYMLKYLIDSYNRFTSFANQIAVNNQKINHLNQDLVTQILRESKTQIVREAGLLLLGSRSKNSR